MPKVIVCATIAAWKCDGTELRWLTHAEKWSGVEWVLAAQIGHGFDYKLGPVTEAVENLGGKVYRFSIDDGEESITTNNRLDYICEGRNIAMTKALRAGAEWLLFLDVDLVPQEDSIEKLLEVDYPVIGGDVPQYVLSNQQYLPNYPYPVEEHWNTAGYMMVRRDVAEKVRWRHEIWNGLSDDPCFDYDCRRLGWPTRVRTDVKGVHDVAIPVEKRNADLRIKQ